MIWTEEQKTEMQRLRDEGVSNNLIGQMFGVSGDIVRKVLLRFQKRSAEPAMAEAAPVDSLDRQWNEFEDKRLRRLHDEFDAKLPERSSSRPKWAGRPPLRITPKDFQKS